MRPKQGIALNALLAGASQTEAAQAAGVAPRTLRGWLHDDQDFASAYTLNCTELAKSAGRRAQAAAGQALDALVEIAANGEAPPAARVSAARALLDQANAATEALDVLARLDALEAERDAG